LGDDFVELGVEKFVVCADQIEEVPGFGSTHRPWRAEDDHEAVRLKR